MPFELENENEFDLINVIWLDALLRHQIYLLRVAGSIRNTIFDILNNTEAKIKRAISGFLVGSRQETRIKQANELNVVLRKIRGDAWDDVAKFLTMEMQNLTGTEVKFIEETLELILPVELNAAKPPTAVLRALVGTKPFEGRLLKDWAARVRQQDIERIENQIKIGVYQGDPTPRIVRRVVGSGALRGRDGATQVTRNNAQAIVRTAVTHFSDAARNEFFMLNADIVSEELFVATLDSRTTILCQSLDGRVFPLGKGPRPPLHWQCRSVRVALIDGEAIGTRPQKPTTQKMLLREYTAAKGLPNVNTRTALPAGHKMKYDKFSRNRIRQMVGQVPAKVNYAQWLKRQSGEFQNDVLGKTRALLFRKGELKLDKFIDSRGKEIPLRELAVKERNAFKAAGLDPAAYQ